MGEESPAPTWARLYRVIFHNSDRILSEYERRFEQHGYFRPIVREVVERDLDRGDPRSGFVRTPTRSQTRWKKEIPILPSPSRPVSLRESWRSVFLRSSRAGRPRETF